MESWSEGRPLVACSAKKSTVLQDGRTHYMKYSTWISLVINLPGQKKTLRMRIWRALKASGAASLRDGVYLLPDSAASRRAFSDQAREVEAGGGSAHLLPFSGEAPVRQEALVALFDRTADYVQIKSRLDSFHRQLVKQTEADARRVLGVLRREITAVAATDFFPGKARLQIEGVLAEAESSLNARFATDEPHAVQRRIATRSRADFRARTWATRECLWIDRVCSAWLIRRFIDPKAKFRWLKHIKDCPKRALGFDFDSAEFTHVGNKVTFEVLVTSFGLEADAGLARLGAMVHYLDVGGIPVGEAAGFAAVVAGARETQKNDDELLNVIAPVLDSLYAAFQAEGSR